jgi:hypothetical protein
LNEQIEVRRLKGFGGREAHAKREWVKLWAQVGTRIMVLPEETQSILLEDFLTAIESRLMFFERITGAHK